MNEGTRATVATLRTTVAALHAELVRYGLVAWTAAHAYVYRAMPEVGDDIGKGIVDTLSGHRSRAVLMRNHGVFTIGRDARAAVKAAVMCEDVARTAHLARALGPPVPIALADIDALHARYQTADGRVTNAPAAEPDTAR